MSTLNTEIRSRSSQDIVDAFGLHVLMDVTVNGMFKYWGENALHILIRQFGGGKRSITNLEHDEIAEIFIPYSMIQDLVQDGETQSLDVTSLIMRLAEHGALPDTEEYPEVGELFDQLEKLQAELTGRHAYDEALTTALQAERQLLQDVMMRIMAATAEADATFGGIALIETEEGVSITLYARYAHSAEQAEPETEASGGNPQWDNIRQHIANIIDDPSASDNLKALMVALRDELGRLFGQAPDDTAASTPSSAEPDETE